MSARAHDLYRPSNLLRPRSKIRETLVIWVMVFLCLASVAFTVKISHVFSRGTVLLFFVAGVVGFIASRVGIAYALTGIISSGVLGGRRVALLTSTNDQRNSKSSWWQGSSDMATPCRRVFDVAQGTVDSEYSSQTAERVSEVLRYARQLPLDEIILAIPWSNTALIDGISAELRSLPIPLKLVPGHDRRTLFGTAAPRSWTREGDRTAAGAAHDGAARHQADNGRDLAGLGLLVLAPHSYSWRWLFASTLLVRSSSLKCASGSTDVLSASTSSGR